MQSALGNYSHSMPSDFWDRVAREVAHRLVGQHSGLGQLGQIGQTGLAQYVPSAAGGIGQMSQRSADPYAAPPLVNRSRTVT